LSPARQEIQSALDAVRQAKRMIKKMADRYDHNAAKEAALELHRDLVAKHAADADAVNQVRTTVYLATSRSAWRQFAALDLAEDMESNID
jgi:hypothetical protein